MTNEELILQKLENLENQLEPMLKFGNNMRELKEDLVPLQNHAFQLMLNELQEVEAGFQLEDLFQLIKQVMRGTKNFIFLLRQMESMIEFVKDLEPLLKAAVPEVIERLDGLERRGVFRMYTAMLDVRAKVADAYTPEDIDQIGDSLVALLGLAKKLSDPKAQAFLEKMADVPVKANLSEAKKIGPFGLASAGFNDEVQQGLGVMIELTKAMGHLKGNGQSSDSEQPAETE